MWMPLSLSQLMTTFSLHWLYWVLLALQCSVLLAGLSAWNSNARLLGLMALRMTEHASKMNSRTTESGSDSSLPLPELSQQTASQLVKKYHPASNGKLTALLIIWLATSILWLWSNASNPVQTLRNVKVINRMDDYNMRLSIEDPDTHQWNEFGATFCSDFKPTPE